MVIDPCAKYGTPMSKLTEVTGRTWRHDTCLYIWPWDQRSTSNHECTQHIVLWWYTHGPNMVSQCRSKKVIYRTRKHVINLTLMSKSKVVSGSWLFATHRLMVIHPCAKYRKPMSNQIKSYGPETNLHRQTDTQSDSYIPSWTSFTGGIIRLIAHFVHGYYQIDKGVFLCMVFSS